MTPDADADGAAPRRSRRPRPTAAPAVLVVLVAGALAVLWADTGSDRPADADAARVTTVAVGAQGDRLRDATTPVPVAEPAVERQRTGLPVPEQLPANAFAPTPEVVLGSIEIPAIDVHEDLHEGMTLTAIDRGPSHWPGTALPGRLGNAVIGGHRTTHSRPFQRLDELETGDLVHFELADGTTSTYEVRDVVVVPRDALGIALQSHAHTATLFACHPPGTATHRIVAKLRLLDDDGTPVDPVSRLPHVGYGIADHENRLLVRPRDDDDPVLVHDPFGSLPDEP